MNYLYSISLLVTTAVSFSLGVTKTSYAETVINTISVEAHSGGNTVQNGETVTGTTESSIDITTTVDGEVVEDVHEASSKGSVYVEHTVVTRGSETITTTNIDTQETEPTSILVVPEPAEPYVAPIVVDPYIVEEPLTSRIDDTATTNASSATIINTPETPGTTSIALSEENAEPPSLVARFLSAISKTLAYVLSNIFS